MQHDTHIDRQTLIIIFDTELLRVVIFAQPQERVQIPVAPHWKTRCSGWGSTLWAVDLAGSDELLGSFFREMRR